MSDVSKKSLNLFVELCGHLVENSSEELIELSARVSEYLGDLKVEISMSKISDLI